MDGNTDDVVVIGAGPVGKDRAPSTENAFVTVEYAGRNNPADHHAAMRLHRRVPLSPARMWFSTCTGSRTALHRRHVSPEHVRGEGSAVEPAGNVYSGIAAMVLRRDTVNGDHGRSSSVESTDDLTLVYPC